MGTPEDRLAKYLSALISSDRYFGRHPMTVEACFDPEATYRGVLFGTAIVTLMLTADARIHEILQISTDHFVKPVRVYVVKNPDGTPKYDSDHQEGRHGCDRRAAFAAEGPQARRPQIAV